MADDVLTKEDKEQMEQDIAKAKKSIADNEAAIQKAKEQGREEATKEAELNKKLEDQERARRELEEKIKSYEEQSSKQNEEFKKQLDSLRESKMVVEPENPFAGNRANPQINADALTDEQVNDIEKESCEAFLAERSRGGNF